MIKLILPIIFILLLSSCIKDETPDPEIPDWLQPRIVELENSEHCFSCNLTRYTYKGEFYYSVYCGYWSCVFCEVYNTDGQKLQELDDLDFEDFTNNRKNEIRLWGCPNSE